MKTRISLTIRWVLNTLLIAGLLAGSAATVTAASAQPASTSAGLADPLYQEDSPPSDPSSYWTPERMASAIPYDVIPNSAPPHAIQRNFIPQAALGEPGWSPSLPPDDFTGTLVTTGEPGTDPAPDPTLDHTTAFVPASERQTFPYSANGKVYFSIGVRNYVCSG
jgi:hypothetical protein